MSTIFTIIVVLLFIELVLLVFGLAKMAAKGDDGWKKK
jgi:hypothetical protein